MDLSKKSAENAEFMIEEIKAKLNVVAGAAIKASHFDVEQYDELRDIYDWVMSKERFSVSEMDAIVSELGKLRKT